MEWDAQPGGVEGCPDQLLDFRVVDEYLPGELVECGPVDGADRFNQHLDSVQAVERLGDAAPEIGNACRRGQFEIILGRYEVECAPGGATYVRAARLHRC